MTELESDLDLEHDGADAGVVDAGATRLAYRPSGRIAWAGFLPLVAAAAAVAGAMAYTLYRVEWSFYFPFVTPFVLALPILVTLLLAIHVGHCRNPFLAALIGAGLAVAYYVGYWGFSYYFNVVVGMPMTRALVQQLGGSTDLVGYFLARCRVIGDGQGANALEWATIGYRGLELGVLLVTFAMAGRRMARRAYYEDDACWAHSTSFLFHPKHLSLVLGTVDRQDWAALDAIDEKLPPTPHARRTGALAFRVEHLPHSAGLPVYVSVEGALLRRWRPLLMIFPDLGRITRCWLRQRLVDVESTRRLAEHVGGLRIRASTPTGSDDVAVASQSQPQLAYWTGSQGGTTAPRSSALVSLIRETGYGGEALVGTGDDFRDAAVAESDRIFAAYGPAAAGAIEASMCLATSEPNAIAWLKRVARLELYCAFAFIASLAVAFVLMWVNTGVRNGGAASLPVSPRTLGLLSLGSWVLVVAVMATMMFLTPVVMKALLRRRIAARGDSQLRRASSGRLVFMRIEDPKTFHISKSAPEDLVICRLDVAGRQLLIEGVTHRYVIRSRDVVRVKPVVFGTGRNAEVTYRVGNVELSLVLQLPAGVLLLVGAMAGQPLIGAAFKPIQTRASVRFAQRIARVLNAPVTR